MKIAAIDAGSNGLRMIVGEADETWRVKILENIRLPVRLGQDVFRIGTLEKATFHQVEEAFLRFRRIADNYGVQKMRAVATSAAREAENRDVLIDRISRMSGIQLELIPGEEEARLIHKAVTNSLNLKNKRTLLIDIGGGSVEVTISTGQEIVSTESYDIGTVRLLEKLDVNHSSKRHVSRLVREYAEAARCRIERELGDEKIQICVGTGGNIEEIGRLRQKLFKADSDRLIMLDELKELIERFDRLTYEERIKKLKLRPDRADVILPASIVLHMIAKEAGVKQIAIPQVGLKDGILLDIAEELSHRPQPHRREQAWKSALHLGHKLQFDENHARQTARLAARLFEQSMLLHNLHEDNLLLLEIASLLHDIGHLVNAVDHEKHGYYLLNANRLFELTQREQKIVASLVLYHRKKSYLTDRELFRNLSQADRIVVNKLCALLRLADAMDISHTRSVDDVILSGTGSSWSIQLASRDESMLARWAVAKIKPLFEEVFGINLEVELTYQYEYA
jgi:exopolyphosphatase/guanosine-5'-triphosphate,3'-diphosphate pyrophosphatase